MRRLAPSLAFLAALAVTLGGIAYVLGARAEEREGAPPPQQALTIVSTSVRPSVHAFGEPVVAELVLVGNAEVVRPETVRIDPDFSPYERAGPGRVERVVSGSNIRWRYRYPLRCLREGCAPVGDRRTFEFPLASVAYRFRLSPGPANFIVEWPSFEVTARVDDAALAERAWRADAAAVPAPSYWFSPAALAAVLLVGTAGFASLGAGLAWRLSRRRESAALEPDEAEVPTLAPLERALELAREASRDGDPPDRRRALERVARELGSRGLADLADRARALAWASGVADPAAIDELARDARAANGGSA